MRVLVTGGTGFVGSHSAAALAAAGHELRLLARDPEKVRRVFAPRSIGIAEVVRGDVTDPDVVAHALAGCEAVLHAAAVVSISARDARRVRDTNRRAVELVVGGASERGLESIVYVSSASVLFTPGTGPIRADSPLATPSSAYATSKTQGERFVRDLEQRGAPIRSSYPPGVIGPDDPGLSEGNHTLAAFLRAMMVDTSSCFEVVDVRDLAAIHARMLDPGSRPGRYVVGGHALPWADVIALMDDLTGRRVPRLRIPGPLLRVLGRIGDLAKRVHPFDYPLTAEAMDFATQWPGTVTSPEVASLGIGLRDARESYRDAIRWMYETGHLTADQVGRIAREPRARGGRP